MKLLGRMVLKNTVSNLVRGCASAVAAVALPHFLTRALDHDRFAAWVLILQVAAYANYLDFGLQTAVARYLAQAMELRDDERRDRLLSTAFGLLATMGALALVSLACIVWALPQVFKVPTPIFSDFRLALVIIGTATALSLPLSTFTGVLVGMHRNEFSAIAVGGSRILGTVAVLFSIHYTHSLVWLALCISGCNMMGGLSQVIIVRHLIPAMRLKIFDLHREMALELVRYCSTLALWSIGMLLITGLDVTIVGHFDFRAAGPYSIAAALITFFTGLNASVCGAMLAPMAVLQTRKKYGQMKKLVITATQLNSYAGVILLLAAVLFGRRLLALWVGPVYATQALPILMILLAAQTVRFMGGGYSTALMAMGQQRHGLFTGISEAVLNLVLSIGGMLVMGAAGVAWATFIAAVVGVALQILVVMPRVREFPINPTKFTVQAIIYPLLAGMAPILWVLARGWTRDYFQTSNFLNVLSLTLCFAAAVWLMWTGLRRSMFGAQMD